MDGFGMVLGHFCFLALWRRLAGLKAGISKMSQNDTKTIRFEPFW